MSNASIQNSIISGTVNLATAGVSPVGFGRTLILGRNGSLPSMVEVFTSLSDVAAYYATSAPEYLAAAFQFSNNARDVAIGKIAASVAQVTNYTITAAADGVWAWELTSNGTTYTGSVTASGSATANAIATLLRADINSVAGAAVTAAGATNVVQVTADVAGRGFTATFTPPSGGTGTLVTATPNVSVGTELDDLTSENDSWFALCVVTGTDEDVYQAAEWVFANPRKVQYSQSSDANILTSATSDVASQIRVRGWFNSKVLYHAITSEYVAAGALANFLSVNQDTTTTTLNLTPVVGGIADQINGTARNYAIGKGASLFLPLLNGGTTGGRILEQASADYKFFDDVVTRAWFKARLDEQALRIMTQVRDLGSKIPQNDGGYTVMQSIVRTVYDLGVSAGKFNANSFTFTSAPTFAQVAELYPSWLTERRYEVTFQCGLAGAVGNFVYTANLIYGE